jgi:hypothetical protein
LLDQVDGAVASFTGDGAYDRRDVYGAVAARHPEAAVVVPPRKDAVPSETAGTAPTQRDRHLRCISGWRWQSRGPISRDPTEEARDGSDGRGLTQVRAGHPRGAAAAPAVRLATDTTDPPAKVGRPRD